VNNAELNKLLQSAPVPDCPPDFWEQFPKRITTEIQRRSRRGAAVLEAPRKTPRFAWALGAGAICLLLALTLTLRHRQNANETTGQFAQLEKCYLKIEAMFPNQIQSIIFDERGPRLVLAQQADVPKSPALYLKICGPRGCQQVVTFSGQQIPVNGDDCDVLLDAAGNVLLVGREFVWSSASPNRNAGKHRIEAWALETHS
jgi:hypothetical protein